MTKTIEYYENKPKHAPSTFGYDDIKTNIKPANDYLINTFGSGTTVDGYVLVAPKGAPGDPIQGTDKNELLLGDSGNDILIGGAGNDVMRGGAGKDLYVYNAGDGQDIIVDNPANGALDGGDGKGAIVYDGHLAGGGIKKSGESDYKSLDNTFTYQWSGNDLTITGSDGTLTVKGFTNGDLGITLVDAPDIVTDFGAATRTGFLRIDHYEQTGVDINGNPIMSPVYAPLFDDNGNSSSQAAPAIGDDNNLLYAGGGSDYVQTGAGDDQVFGEGGSDTVYAGQGNDRVSGGTEGDNLSGEGGSDTMSGGVFFEISFYTTKLV
ncbi:MAG: hypothetical protein AAB356_07575, partial [Deltaproteobacteria bacterium]